MHCHLTAVQAKGEVHARDVQASPREILVPLKPIVEYTYSLPLLHFVVALGEHREGGHSFIGAPEHEIIAPES